MPTTARLVGAILFAALGYVVAVLYMPGLPPETRFGRFTQACAVIGALVGWLIMGRLAGGGWRSGMGAGLRCAVTMAFYAILIFSSYEMILRSLNKRYDGVMSAIEGTFDIALVYGTALLRPEPLSALILGGLAAGGLVDWVRRHWR